MKDQLKKRLLDLVFVALAGLVGLGGFYVYASVRAHQAMDKAIIDILQQQVQPEPQQPRGAFDQELPE